MISGIIAINHGENLIYLDAYNEYIDDVISDFYIDDHGLYSLAQDISLHTGINIEYNDIEHLQGESITLDDFIVKLISICSDKK